MTLHSGAHSCFLFRSGEGALTEGDHDLDRDSAGLSIFKNFLEGVVAASLTSTMEAAEAPTASTQNLRRSSRLHNPSELVNEIATPLQRIPKKKKVTNSLYHTPSLFGHYGVGVLDRG
jgi:hypothetical protein